MRRSLLILLLAGCGGASSEVVDVPPELGRAEAAVPEAPDRWTAPLEGLKPGQWARYAEGGQETTFRVDRTEGDGVWIEVIAEGPVRTVSARLVGPDGAVVKALYAEVGKPPVPQPLSQAPPPAAPKGTEVSREVGEEKVKVGDRELTAVRLRVVREDVEGRRTEEVTLWHPAVPPLRAGSPHGGLVRRQGLELKAFGEGAVPVLVK
jgi:hypothetical protein